jgi:NAD(P)-dependent dehydrogenase (short-subunit alcohol dehydrogenase family)
MTLQDKVVLITGAKRIGQAVATACARRGARVAVTYRTSRSEAEALVRGIEAGGGQAVAVPADVSRRPDVERLVASVIDRFGGVDILVHMASRYARTPLPTLDEAAWEREVAANLTGAYLCALAVVPSMRARGGGRIITVADWTAAGGRPRYRDYLPYYTSKGGLIRLTEALALELAADQILVNSIAPGPILPPPDLAEAEDREVRAATPLGRWGGAEEIAKAVLFLIEADFVTGHCLVVDGGRHLR